MNFLLPIIPVWSYTLTAFMIMLVSFALIKIFKIEINVPWSKISAVLILLAVVFSVFNILNSPITRPVISNTVNDARNYKVDKDKVLEAPVLKDNSFKPEEVRLTPTRKSEYVPE